MRVRKVITRSGTFERSQFPGLKSDTPIHCEGGAEARYCRILHADGNVCGIAEQALFIPFVGPDGPSEAIPDFVVTFVDRHYEIHEVKTLRNLKKAGALARLRAIQRGARDLGYACRLVTDREINREPRLSAAELICGRGRIEITPDLIEAARELAPLGLTIGEFRLRLGASRDEICALILQGYLLIDLGNGVADETIIRGLGWRRALSA